jgi:DNA-binding transcriptional ArsR family regulator
VGDEELQVGAWTLLTGHGHVLVEIARNPDARLRDVAAVAGITERAVQAIISDLEGAGYLTRKREGRRNRYTVNRESLFRHPAQEGHRIGPLLDLLAAEGDPAVQPRSAGEKETRRWRPARQSRQAGS